MATHSSLLAWRVPWTEEPGGLQSMGSQRVGRDLATTWQCNHITTNLGWGALKPTEIYSLTFQKAKSQKSRCPRAELSLETPREVPFPPLVASGRLQAPLFLWSYLSSLRHQLLQTPGPSAFTLCV